MASSVVVAYARTCEKANSHDLEDLCRDCRDVCRRLVACRRALDHIDNDAHLHHSHQGNRCQHRARRNRDHRSSRRTPRHRGKPRKEGDLGSSCYRTTHQRDTDVDRHMSVVGVYLVQQRFCDYCAAWDRGSGHCAARIIRGERNGRNGLLKQRKWRISLSRCIPLDYCVQP